MDIDWTQPYILIFEWGMFILGWLLIVVLASIAIAITFAFLKAAVMVLLGKKPGPRRKSSTTHDSDLNVKRDIYGRFTL